VGGVANFPNLCEVIFNVPLPWHERVDRVVNFVLEIDLRTSNVLSGKKSNLKNNISGKLNFIVIFQKS
jgi:hypothetical protein